MRKRRLFFILFVWLAVPVKGQILDCTDSNDVYRMSRYIVQNALNGFVIQLNLLANDRDLKRNTPMLKESQANFINSYFVDTNAVFYNTFINREIREHRSVDAVLADMNVFYGADTLNFDLSDIYCTPELYYHIPANTKGKPFMYMIASAILTCELKNDRKDLYDFRIDTLAFFFKIPAFSELGVSTYGNLNPEDIRISQIINKNLIKDKLIVAFCETGEQPSFITGSESESFIQLTYGKLDFTTTPADATIRFHGFPGAYPSPIHTDSFSVNTYKVTVSRNGYFSKDTTISISQYKRAKIHVSLVPMEGKFVFVSNPPSDTIIIDGIKMPLKKPFYMLTVGEHTITAKAKYYNDTTFNFVIKHGEITKQEISLSHKMGYLRIYSSDGSLNDGYFSIEGTKYMNSQLRDIPPEGYTIAVHQGEIGVLFGNKPWNQNCNIYQEGYFTYKDTILIPSQIAVPIDVKLIPYRTVLIVTKPVRRQLRLFVNDIEMPCSSNAYIPLSIGSHRFLFMDGDVEFPFSRIVERKKKKLKFKLNE